MNGHDSYRDADLVSSQPIQHTSQKAIARALKLSLRRVSEHFNATEVESIQFDLGISISGSRQSK